MFIASVLSAFALAHAGGHAELEPYTPGLTSAPVAQTQQQTPADLGEVVVQGRRLRDLTNDFVGEVAAPANGRRLARWNSGVCVGVVNLRNEAAQYIADRVSTVASDLGLRPGAPGCQPTIVISFTDDADAFTQAFVARTPRQFRTGASGMDRGRSALNRFQNNDQPVRWWTVSAPIDSHTGEIATRIPGECQGTCEDVLQAAPVISVHSASRLRTQIVDTTLRAYVVVDVNKLQGVSLTQLADYLAFVSLAQIDPDANTSGYLSVLNVFDDPLQTDTLTQWDHAYLRGLYSAERTLVSTSANAGEIVDSIVSAHRGLTAEQEAMDDLQQ